MKLWHDDVRKPPTGWLWARTNDEAKLILGAYRVVEISLDHDLGGHNISPDDPDAIYFKGADHETGLDLVDWMIANERVPKYVTIHSWNPVGARRMIRTLENAWERGLIAYDSVKYKPYEVPDERSAV